MSIASEIERIKTNIANAYVELESKGATLPTERNSDNLSNVITTVPTGGGDMELEQSFMSNIDNTRGSNCTKLPNATTSIGTYAFYNRTNLALKSLPSGVTSIGNYAFYNCTNLALSNLPSGITSISIYSFYNCTNLALKSLPSDTTYIGAYAFYKCSNIVLTSLPENINTLGNFAFNQCTKLALTSLPSGITTIPNNCFTNCKALKELTCLGAITSIGNYAFEQCSNLSKFILPNVTNVPTLSSSSVFGSTPIASGTGYIYVPDTLISDFQSASNWTKYASQIKGVSEL